MSSDNGRADITTIDTTVTDHPFEPRDEWYGRCKHCPLAEASHVETTLDHSTRPPTQGPPPPRPTAEGDPDPAEELDLPIASTHEINMLDEHLLKPTKDPDRGPGTD